MPDQPRETHGGPSPDLLEAFLGQSQVLGSESQFYDPLNPDKGGCRSRDLKLVNGPFRSPEFHLEGVSVRLFPCH